MNGKIKNNNDNQIYAPAVSVIIPFYNAEKYVEEMLRTVRGQTLKEIEIICISDGSVDGSEDIIKNQMRVDSRVHLYTQEKSNAGVARNTGLSYARGKYVTFWDADDLFCESALEELYKKSEQTKADVCVCEVSELHKDGKRYETGGYLQKKKVPDKDPFNKYDMPGDIFGFASNMVWNKLFRRSFLVENKLDFQNIRQGNDTAFVMRAMYKADRITTVWKNLVYYRVNNSNGLTSQSSETWKCPYESFQYTKQCLEKEADFPLVEKGFQNKMLKGLYRSLNMQTSFISYEALYQFLKEEGFREAGIYDMPKKSMEESWMYTDLQKIKELSPGDFLLYKSKDRMLERDRLKFRIRKARKDYALLIKMIEKGRKIKARLRNAGKRNSGKEETG